MGAFSSSHSQSEPAPALAPVMNTRALILHMLRTPLGALLTPPHTTPAPLLTLQLRLRSTTLKATNTMQAHALLPSHCPLCHGASCLGWVFPTRQGLPFRPLSIPHLWASAPHAPGCPPYVPALRSLFHGLLALSDCLQIPIPPSTQGISHRCSSKPCQTQLGKHPEFIP